MFKSNIHLHYNGRCEEALEFYTQCLGGKVTFKMTWGESPAAQTVPADWATKIIHASFEFDGQMISADDAPVGSQAEMQGFNITLSTTNLVRAGKVFEALSKGGKVLMPFAKTFWSPGFGMLVDQFGVPWMISTSESK